jgi:hypothetical protein
MKKIAMMALLLICGTSKFVHGQTPKDYTDGSITLITGTTLNGSIKENFAKKGNLVFIDKETNKTKTFNGTSLKSVSIGSELFQVIKSDFFKIITKGKIELLEKVSKTSNEIIYSGNTPIGIEGTEGKKGDLFVFTNNTLKLVTKNNFQTILKNEVESCADAVSQLAAVDFTQITSVIATYNSCNK